jgi:mono/diheme cytochrome c family protein
MVTVTGVNDNDAVRETVIISHAISGGGYDTVSMASFTATMIDDDTATAPVATGKSEYRGYCGSCGITTGRWWLRYCQYG